MENTTFLKDIILNFESIILCAEIKNDLKNKYGAITLLMMNTLPQSILNLIGEFNPDHRTGLKNALYDIKYKNRMCYNCNRYIDNLHERKTQSWMGCNIVFCSRTCWEESDFDNETSDCMLLIFIIIFIAITRFIMFL